MLHNSTLILQFSLFYSLACKVLLHCLLTLNFQRMKITIITRGGNLLFEGFLCLICFLILKTKATAVVTSTIQSSWALVYLVCFFKWKYNSFFPLAINLVEKVIKVSLNTVSLWGFGFCLVSCLWCISEPVYSRIISFWGMATNTAAVNIGFL